MNPKPLIVLSAALVLSSVLAIPWVWSGEGEAASGTGSSDSHMSHSVSSQATKSYSLGEPSSPSAGPYVPGTGVESARFNNALPLTPVEEARRAAEMAASFALPAVKSPQSVSVAGEPVSEENAFGEKKRSEKAASVFEKFQEEEKKKMAERKEQDSLFNDARVQGFLPLEKMAIQPPARAAALVAVGQPQVGAMRGGLAARDEIQKRDEWLKRQSQWSAKPWQKARRK